MWDPRTNVRGKAVTPSLLVLAAILGCADAALAPKSRTDVRAVYFGNGGIGVITDEGDAVERLDALDLPVRGRATSGDLPWILLSILPPGETGHLSFYDVCAGREVKRVDLGDGTLPGSSIVLGAGYTLATTRDGDRIFYSQATKAGDPGIAILDGSAREAVGFLEGIEPFGEGIAVIPPGPAFPGGAIAVNGRRVGQPDQRVYIASHRGELLDSLGGPGTSMRNVLGALQESDGRHLWLASPSALARVDLTTGAVVASAPWPGFGAGQVAEVGDGTFLVTDTGYRIDYPGFGYVYRLDEDLDVVERIDVTTLFGGALESPTSTQTWGVAVDKESGVAWVVAGTMRRGPLFPLQPPRVLEIDLATNEVVRVMDAPGLGDLGVISPC